MYRRMDPQRKLFDAGGLLTPAKQEACEKSWAGPFRQKALPILRRVEGDFASLFDPQLGRPNRPVPLVLGTLILKEMSDLTDEEALNALEFDTRWWYAFELEPHELHLCQKTLHTFRKELMLQDKSKLAFRRVTDELIAALEIRVDRQRLDSKHIVSNIAMLTRLGLMCETIRVFLATVKALDQEAYGALGEKILQRHGEEAHYADARSKEGRRRLEVVARDVWRLVDRFGNHEEVKRTEAWKLLKRVLEEQCEATKPEAAAPRSGEDDEGDGPAPATPRSEPSGFDGAEAPGPSGSAGPSPEGAAGSAAPPRPPQRSVADALLPVAQAAPAPEPKEAFGPEGDPSVGSGPSAVPPAAAGDSRTVTPPKADDDSEGSVPVRLRPAQDVPSDSLQSPHDPDATYSGHKGKGYATQVAETCCNGQKPELITDVEVTPACDSDAKATVPMVKSLQAAGHKPGELVADTGFSSGDNAATLSDKGVQLLAPAPAPAKPKPGRVYDPPAPTCPTDPAKATEWLRAREASPDFHRRYSIRAGIEATNSELDRAHGLDKLRVRGLSPVKLSVYFKALACNLKRALRWWLTSCPGAPARGAACPA